MVRGLLGRGCFFPQGVGRVFAADDPLCSSCHCNHGPAALPASLDPERIKWSARTDWGAGDPPGSFSEDGVMCDACVYRALSVLRVPLVSAVFCLLVGAVRGCLRLGGVSGVLSPRSRGASHGAPPRSPAMCRPLAGRSAPLSIGNGAAPRPPRRLSLCAASPGSGCPDPLRRVHVWCGY